MFATPGIAVIPLGTMDPGAPMGEEAAGFLVCTLAVALFTSIFLPSTMEP
jgi:hypothetical protein